MAQKKKDAVITQQDVPSYVKVGNDAAGVTEKLDVGASIPRLYAVGKMSAKETRQDHGIGSLVIAEGDSDFTKIAEMDEVVTVAPLWRWLSWMKIRDREEVTEEFWIIEETLDQESEIAQRAKDSSLRNEPYPDGQLNSKGAPLMYRWIENINWVFFVLDGPAKGRCVVGTFAKGGWKYGKRLYSYIQRRGVDIYANRIGIKVTEVENKAGDAWEQIVHEVVDPYFVDAETYEVLGDEYKKIPAMIASLAPQKS